MRNHRWARGACHRAGPTGPASGRPDGKLRPDPLALPTPPYGAADFRSELRPRYASKNSRTLQFDIARAFEPRTHVPHGGRRHAILRSHDEQNGPRHGRDHRVVIMIRKRSGAADEAVDRGGADHLAHLFEMRRVRGMGFGGGPPRPGRLHQPPPAPLRRPPPPRLPILGPRPSRPPPP